MVNVGHAKLHAGEYVGRPGSPLGNPASHRPSAYATVAVNTVEEALSWYESWLDACLLDLSSPQSLELKRLCALEAEKGNVTLLCWCSRTLRCASLPPRCHADIIASRMHKA